MPAMLRHYLLGLVIDDDPSPTTTTRSLTSRLYLLAEALTLSLRDALCCVSLSEGLFVSQSIHSCTP
jgi:hypothetical protein